MDKASILIVEDDDDLREALVDTLAMANFTCWAVENAELAIIELAKKTPALILSDVNMPGMNGLSFLKTAKRNAAEIPVILMTAYGKVNDAVTAMQDGAADYILKPFEPKELVNKIKQCLPSDNTSSDNPIAVDPSSQHILSLAKRAAQSDVPILVSGESGTGKEVLARYIHDNSNRSNKEFVAINCAAIPENMLEATLFGYEKGAFTGAVKSHPGKFEQAQGGTLLLDEISEMDLNLQAKLLRVLQESEVERLGSQQTIKLDVRVIATTNRDLKLEIAESRFREDLFYRLNVFPLHWMPLRERANDIIPMVNYLVKKHAAKFNRSIPTLTSGAAKKLIQYPWPGNIREMDNIVQRALILQPGAELEAEDFELEMSNTKAQISNDSKLAGDVMQKEFECILQALDVNPDRKAAANQLGISPRTLRYKLAKMREQGIEV